MKQYEAIICKTLFKKRLLVDVLNYVMDILV